MERDGRKSVDFDLRGVENDDDDDSDDDANSNDVHNGRKHSLENGNSRHDGNSRLTHDSAAYSPSYSSPRNSSQSFTYDSRDAHVNDRVTSLGLSESMNSFATISSRGSHSSQSSENSSSAGNSTVPVSLLFRITDCRSMLNYDSRW